MSHLFTQWGAKHAPKIMANVKGIQRQIFGWDTVANGKDYVQFLAVFAKAFTKEVEIRGKCTAMMSRIVASSGNSI